MNILIFFMSMLQKKPLEITYNAGGTEITGTQTNEAATKYLIKNLADNQERLDKVIAITSCEAKKDALEVFRKGIELFCADKYFMPEIITADTFSDENTALPDMTVFENVLGYISTDDVVYFDVTGGRRTEADKMLLLMKLVKYKGICLKNTIYSQVVDYVNGTGEVCSHNDSYRYLDILDGVNQFVLTGNAAQLSKCYDTAGAGSKVGQLLGTMTDFSDSMTICSTSGLDKILEDMRDNIKAVSGAPCCNMEDFLFKQLIPVINDKFFGKGDTPDYCHIISWCLENQLVQQAVTIYVEKMPKYILDKGLVIVSDELRQQTKDNWKNPENLNVEKELFFSGLMSCNGDFKNDEKELIERLKIALKLPSNYNIKDRSINKARQQILKFAEDYDSKKDYSKDKVMSDIAASLHGTVFDSKKKRINQICNNEQSLRVALELPAYTDDTIMKKIYVIKHIKDITLPDGFTLGIGREELRKIMIDYLYVRGVRNMINHASDNRETTEQLKKLFKENSIGTEFSKDAIIKEIEKSVKYISGLSPSRKEENKHALSH